MSAMLLASHPAPVREAIARYRDALDADPVTYLESNNDALQRDAMRAAGRYLGVDENDIALTESTTMSAALVYNGLDLKPGQEVLTTDQGYYVTHESLRLAAEKRGASMRFVSLYDDIAVVEESAMVDRLISQIRPETRVLALTWVHSSTGLKIPVRAIRDAVEEFNADRGENDEVLICLDAVHGFGVEEEGVAELGCDFFMAGCHKWLFGPRGTGVVAGSVRGWRALSPTIPSFLDSESWSAWITRSRPDGPTDGPRLSPGGFKPYEHRWALSEAFAFHAGIGRANVANRTHELAGQLKQGLADTPGVTLVTPMSSDLSSGIVSFDLAGHEPGEVVRRLRDRRIIASVAPYATPHVRLTPGIRNTPGEIDTVLSEIGALTA